MKPFAPVIQMLDIRLVRGGITSVGYIKHHYNHERESVGVGMSSHLTIAVLILRNAVRRIAVLILVADQLPSTNLVRPKF
ncbi:hypothetical protein BH09GEM1_BH09GEM1_35820 [soil metagenome]